MKKLSMMFAAFLLALGVAGAMADSYTYTITLTNTQPITYSDAIPVSGWLDKIEVHADVASTTTVTVASYSSGNQAIETYMSKAVTNAAATNAVFIARPRTVGTDSGGVYLTANGGASNVFQATGLSVPYERIMMGGNVKVAVTGTGNDGSAPVTVTIYTLPTPR
jgi:hypothetical protein